MSKVEEFSLSQQVKQAEGNIVSDMNGEKVMLCVKNGKYYNLGVLGGQIWEIIKQPVSIEEVVTKLIEQYDVEQKQCEEETIAFLQQLVKEGLVEIE
ncbi:lasso peptide biosynthesis PqqD family chaperone [Aquibacillus rhizosphaerae]|uniref:Lasso peptide biosynthesis PqqD family chaperone n=1 Tax=Aquibacillus rhizosphaerae TaxID=3051431 RepID=A0ABT7KZL0_9BACI|nr:lasso peptide biosynthesis PqqD family chaperone [Aquibacillus sp. LR5S19]MDL4838976.1 lasso peptide biosynthesis PqqD family chaperone [Aquibacillus sp. LR5S19]